MATVEALFDLGLRRIRRPGWEPDTYLEMSEIGGLRSPIIRLRNVRLEQPGNVALLGWDTRKQTLPLVKLPGGSADDWTAYEGELAPEMEEL